MPFEDETVEMANLCSPPQICAVTQETFRSRMDNLFPVELRVANLYVRTLPEHYLEEHNQSEIIWVELEWSQRFMRRWRDQNFQSLLFR